MTASTPDRPLSGRVAVVTGSTSGIGQTVAESLAKAGASVVLNGFGDAAAIENLRKTIESQNGVKVIYSAADMSKPASIQTLFDDANKALGAPDIIVNNAGIQVVSPIEDFPPEKWDAIIAINLSSAFHMTRLAIPAMRKQNWGRIVNIASAHGLVASPFKSAYVSAKHGVVGLTKTVALEVAEQQITCNAICPGYVHTPLVDKQIDDQAKVHNIPRDRVIKEVILQAQPNKRFVTTEQIAALTLFLCSEEGSSINGAALAMDGGWVAQ
ncbi:MAG: 3-hydroxybutyrate dehydrogenase [Caulobacterales bacterium]